MRTLGLARRLFVVAAVAGAALSFAVPPAHAYPQWQFTSGVTRCNQCHFAPAGGGPITSYGRDAAGEDLATFEGNGAFLHGVLTLPARLDVGGDLRGALLAHDVQDPDGSTVAAFPMQAELHARVALPAGVSIFGSGGLRGQVRHSDAIVPTQNYQPTSTSRLISREHYVTWQPARLGPYARVGRFHAPFGLRLAEHTTYVRRDLGFGFMEESYNLSGGIVRAGWELHATAFAPDVVRHMGSQETGGAVYYERRILDDAAAVGAQAKLSFGDGMDRLIAGAVGKYYLRPARTLFLGEANLVRQMFDGGTVGDRHQIVALLGLAVLPVRGLVITVLAERNQRDVMVRDSAWNAVTGLVSWFPYPHLELQMAGQLQFPAGGAAAKTVLWQLHYFL